MTVVRGMKRKRHFRHIPPPHPSNGSGGALCYGCSDEHLRAQVLLRDHDYDQHPILFTEWLDCKKHTRIAYTAAGKPDIRLEEKEEGHGRCFVSDLTYSEHGRIVMRVEVWKTHRADPVSRMGVRYVEVRADIIAMLRKIPRNSPIALRCEAIESCTDCSTCNTTDALVKIARQSATRAVLASERARRAVTDAESATARIAANRNKDIRKCDSAVCRANHCMDGAAYYSDRAAYYSDRAARSATQAMLSCVRIANTAHKDSFVYGTVRWGKPRYR